LSLHAVGVTERRFSRSIRKPGRASRRLHAGCRSGSLRASPEPIPEDGSSPGSDIAYPETNSSHWGETDVVSKVLDAVSELGSDAGLVVLDKKICTKVLVKRPILQHVVGGG
jgi:hypothetical protein